MRVDNPAQNRREFLKIVAVLATASIINPRLAKAIEEDVDNIYAHHILCLQFKDGRTKTFNLDVDEVRVEVNRDTEIWFSSHSRSTFWNDQPPHYVITNGLHQYVAFYGEIRVEEDVQGHSYYTMTLKNAEEYDPLSDKIDYRGWRRSEGDQKLFLSRLSIYC